MVDQEPVPVPAATHSQPQRIEKRRGNRSVPTINTVTTVVAPPPFTNELANDAMVITPTEAVQALDLNHNGGKPESVYGAPPLKTPVSILQELLSRRGITPSYELVQIEGAIHEPTFRYRVSFNDKDAMGAGRSKKEAKHAAAKTLIDKLTGMPSFMANLGPANGNSPNDVQSMETNQPMTSEEKAMGNPIGWLQELCMSRRWPPPNYETEEEVGLPHERQFTIACVVLKYREIGQGKSKKIAKRLAAQKMWYRLQENPLDPNQINSLADEATDEANRITNILNRYGDLKDAHIPTLTNQHSYKVAQFHKTLKATFGKGLAVLQTTCLNQNDLNYITLLQQIATEHQFEVTYVDIEEKTYAGQCQCLVQLSTLPVAVCIGMGVSSKEAQANAAHHALEYLKIMTKVNKV